MPTASLSRLAAALPLSQCLLGKPGGIAASAWHRLRPFSPRFPRDRRTPPSPSPTCPSIQPRSPSMNVCPRGLNPYLIHIYCAAARAERGTWMTSRGGVLICLLRS